MSSENSDDLFRRGEFLRFVNATSLDPTHGSKRSPSRQLKLATALALLGDLLPAAQIARRYVDIATDPRTRADAECVLALCAWRNGDVAAAIRHFPLSLRFGVESKDAERIAWTYLHMLRFYVDFHPADVVNGMLPTVRKAVMSAGNRHAISYLHSCVSTLEGQSGRIDEAWRHCHLSESLLLEEPNAWILANSLLNRACICSLNCEFQEAERYIRAAKEARSSNRPGSIVLDGSLGYVQLQTGELLEAEHTLRTILDDSCLVESRKQPVRETYARVKLALNQLDECSEHLSKLSTTSDGSGTPTYIDRWAAITRARMLARSGELKNALDQLERVLDVKRESPHDSHSTAAIDLMAAQLLARMGRQKEAARRFFACGELGIMRWKDLQGQFYYGGALALPDAPQSRELRKRALRIWASQGVLASRLEMDERPPSLDAARQDLELARRSEPTISGTASSVTTALAAAIDLAHQPSLIGHELLSVIRALGCGAEAEVVQNTKQAARRDFAILRLGRQGEHSTALRCRIPEDPDKALLLADVFRIGRAALALEKARQEDRKRAALWPSDPIEEQAGALYVAESMQTLLDTARRVAAANIPVLITGETGTGKEVLARLIHSYSPRAARTFLPFNCSATPREMLDAQLFGHRKGAFTGASEHFAGVIRAAAGGTLFLDEIGESSLEIQPKLLRFLESGEVHPIGETHPQRVDVRVLAATNADVDALVTQGRFREDLFYRLNIVRLHIPPLRERRVEIPSFANHYLQKYAKEMGKSDLRLSEETMEYLVLYRWPGNVRQIANEMRRLAALAEPGAVLMPEHLSADIASSRRTVPVSDRALDSSEIVVRIDQPLGAAIQHVEHAMVQTALAKTSSVDEAARLLGLSRKGLYLKRLRFGMEIDRPKTEIEVA